MGSDAVGKKKPERSVPKEDKEVIIKNNHGSSYIITCVIERM